MWPSSWTRPSSGAWVFKRCIYGVDENPLTVELAKVSLWLHSFSVGAPSFLDHHLRCGDTLIRVRVREAVRGLDRLGGLFTASAIAGAEVAAEGMAQIEAMSDTDVVEVHESASLFHTVEEATADLRGLLNFLCGLQWMTAGMKTAARSRFETPLAATLSRRPTDAYRILARGPQAASDAAGDGEVDPSHWAILSERWQEAQAIARREEFLHWEAAFPGVWRHWQNRRPEGGFDAVIGIGRGTGSNCRKWSGSRPVHPRSPSLRPRRLDGPQSAGCATAGSRWRQTSRPQMRGPITSVAWYARPAATRSSAAETSTTIRYSSNAP